MERYTEEQLLRLAKRHHNTKRTYLLVDPLQGKHIPVSPSRSLQMLRTLGRRFAEVTPEVDLVIGFAQTATAVGGAVAAMLSDGCRYIHTTRQPSAITGRMIEFREEHSHAAEQLLCMDRLGDWLREARAIAFVDDELSTGKTLLNIITEIRAHCPEIAGKPLWAVSIIDRLTPERTAALAAEGVQSFSLLKLPMTDLTAQVAKYAITAPEAPAPLEDGIGCIDLPPTTADTRLGCRIGDFMAQCQGMAETLCGQLSQHIRGKRVTLLGTEEWMLPGLLLGERIEAMGEAASVLYHATTRSPIGICTDPAYPIRGGAALHSFYETDRPTFLYNLQPCDVVLILTDAPDRETAARACRDLRGAYAHPGCGGMILIREAAHVQHVSQ